MKLLICLVATSLFACTSNTSVESKIKLYMKDSVVPKFNDPSSYQFISTSEPDSITNHYIILEKKGQYLEELQLQNAKRHTNEIEMISDKMESTGSKLDVEILKRGKHIDSLYAFQIGIINDQIAQCDKRLSFPDSLHHVRYTVNYRGKNKMGALVLDELKLNYFQTRDSFYLDN